MLLVVTPNGAGSIFHWYQMDTAGNIIGPAAYRHRDDSQLTQTNMWLGRSEYGDQDADASYDEVRLFNRP